MSVLCLRLTSKGVLSPNNSNLVASASDCVGGFVAQDSATVLTQTGINSVLDALFAEYFSFDLQLSELIMTAYFLSFISGHVLGRVISGLRKAG